MFSRGLSELVTISKSAIKLNLAPWMQDDSVVPVRESLMLVTSETRTSLAVQFSASDEAVDPTAAPFPMLYSFCKQVCEVCANAGAARAAIASTTQQTSKSVFPFLRFIIVLLVLL